MGKAVRILLAAYKGGAYIRPMIDSILDQDCDDWELILSDDGEETAPVLQEYADAYPDRIIHYRSGLRFGNAQKHFMHLLNTFGKDAPYCMFCDQDDVWHPDKVRKTLAHMQKIETDPSRPAMVHTDLRVVDGELRELAPSFIEYSTLDGSRLALNQLLVQNVVTGCTMMVNRTLAVLADREVPADKILMHDWWLALLAAACGDCGYLPEATIDYRQHGNNSVGAQNAHSVGHMVKKAKSDIYGAMCAMGSQAGALAVCYEDLIAPPDRQMLTDFAGSFQKGKWARLDTYRKYALWKTGLAKKAGQLLWG